MIRDRMGAGKAASKGGVTQQAEGKAGGNEAIQGGLWRRAAVLEKTSGSHQRLDAVLARAVVYCPKNEMLWLMGAKEKWIRGDVDGARSVLQEAFAANPESEQVVLAAFVRKVTPFPPPNGGSVGGERSG